MSGGTAAGGASPNDGGEDAAVSSKTLLEMLRRLPPSKELLDFYHEKVEKFSAEEKKWLQRLANSKVLTQQIQKLDKEVANQKREISALQKAVSDMQSALVQERKISAKVYAENDKLKIEELENRRKIVALLELAGQTDQELVRMLDNEDRMNLGISLEGDFVPQRIRRYIEKIKEEPERLSSLRRTAGCSKLQMTALENQLLEQEKCHLQQLSQLENERKLSQRDREAERAQFEHRIKDLSDYVNKMDSTQDSILKELDTAKAAQRKVEQRWTSEKETLLRKLQFVQHYGTILPQSMTTEGGFFTDKRGEARRGADQKAQRQIQKLNTELAEQKNLVGDYRNQLLTVESELESLRDQSNANKEVLKSRTKHMIDQVEVLKQRYESLEGRRKREAEGYHTDVSLLKQKLRHVEQQLIRASIAKTKEHEYIKTIKAYDREIDKLKRKLKSQWQDPDPL